MATDKELGAVLPLPILAMPIRFPSFLSSWDSLAVQMQPGTAGSWRDQGPCVTEELTVLPQCLPDL